MTKFDKATAAAANRCHEIDKLRKALEQCARIAEAIDRAGDDAVPQSMRGKRVQDVYKVARAALAGFDRNVTQ